MTEIDEAKNTVACYISLRGQAPPDVFMAYMRARQVLDKAGITKMDAGQRGFMAATARVFQTAVVQEQATLSAPAPAPAPEKTEPIKSADGPPKWATERFE